MSKSTRERNLQIFVDRVRERLTFQDLVVIAGNGVFEQAEALGIPVRIVESDGPELTQ